MLARWTWQLRLNCYGCAKFNQVLTCILLWCGTSHSNAKSALLICSTVANTRQRVTPCCSLLNIEQTAQDIYQLYRLRFQIEFIFRDAKQFTGLSDCQARDAKKLDFHFNASFTALNLAKLDAHRQHSGQQPFVFSIVLC
jgi:hypothetical protein